MSEVQVEVDNELEMEMEGLRGNNNQPHRPLQGRQALENLILVEVNSVKVWGKVRRRSSDLFASGRRLLESRARCGLLQRHSFKTR